VEAHAAAWLWLNPHVKDATLYLNREPCSQPNGCHRNLNAELPPGTRLTVYGPREFWDVYYGPQRGEGGT
jgi:SCP1.201-like deaminase